MHSKDVTLIVGLGNPGSGYKSTRHNTGFRIIDHLSRNLGVRLKGRRFQSRNIRTACRGREIVLLKPFTFMNQSGRAVKACADFFHLPTNRILVVHDDLDLPAGRIKVVRNGGPGGHKGVASIIEHLGGMEFPRIKIGIGRPRYGESPEDYVLAPFYQDESEMMQRVFKMAVRACQLFISEGVESVMSKINRQIFINEEEKNLCRD